MESRRVGTVSYTHLDVYKRQVKELLQERHLAQLERKRWPVALSGDEIVWMLGFPVPARWLAKIGQEAVPVSYTHLDVYKRQTHIRDMTE